MCVSKRVCVVNQMFIHWRHAQPISNSTKVASRSCTCGGGMMDGSLAINICSIYNYGKDRPSHIHNHCGRHLLLVVHLHVNFDAFSPVVPD